MTDKTTPKSSGSGRGLGTWLRGTPTAVSAGTTNEDRPEVGEDVDARAFASGEAMQVTQLRLDPARARIWPGNARIYTLLTVSNCRDLIESIIAEGGQKVPAIVRPIAGDPDHDFEVITGTRRHFSISWLRASGREDLFFIAQVENLNDEAAFRLADLENRARNDVSDFERARNYAAALDSHYDGHLTRMAERLNLSKGWLSKMIRIASLPEAVIGAFPDPRDLRLRSAYALSRAMEADGAAAAVVAMAVQIARAQEARIADGHPPHGPGEILRALMEAAGEKPSPADLAVVGPGGKPAISIVSTSKSGVTIKLHAGSGASRDDLIAGVTAMIDKLALGANNAC